MFIAGTNDYISTNKQVIYIVFYIINLQLIWVCALILVHIYTRIAL